MTITFGNKKPMLVGDLKKVLDKIPDDVRVLVASGEAVDVYWNMATNENSAMIVSQPDIASHYV